MLLIAKIRLWQITIRRRTLLERTFNPTWKKMILMTNRDRKMRSLILLPKIRSRHMLRHPLTKQPLIITDVSLHIPHIQPTRGRYTVDLNRVKQQPYCTSVFSQTKGYQTPISMHHQHDSGYSSSEGRAVQTTRHTKKHPLNTMSRTPDTFIPPIVSVRPRLLRQP